MRTDSIKSRLQSAATAADSVPYLYHIYDLATGRSRTPAAMQLYQTAVAANNYKAQIDALLLIANLNSRNDSILTDVANKMKRMSPSKHLSAAKLFTGMLQIDNMVVAEPNEMQNYKILEFSRRFGSNPPSDIYERAALLYALCRYLSAETQGELLSSYVNRLEKLVDSIPMASGALQRLVYNRAAGYYLDAEDYEKSIEMNHKLLDAIDTLEVNYAEQGRHFRNASTYRYSTYRRLLSAYPALTREQVEDYYTRILSLAEIDDMAAQDLKNFELPSIYYAMATGDYENAKIMILRQMEKPLRNVTRLKMLRMLHKAATKTNDRKVMFESAEDLVDELEKLNTSKKQESARELKIMYDMNELRHTNSMLELEQQQAELKTKTVIIISTCALAVLLVIILIILIRKDNQRRRLTEVLKKSNASLATERDDLKRTRTEILRLRDKANEADKMKSDFINNMSHEITTPLKTISEYSQLIVDCIPEEKSRYLGRFAEIIRLNVRLVLTIVNEVLDIASIEHGNMTVDKQPSDVRQMCNLAIDNVFDRISGTTGDVTVLYNTGNMPDITVNTDSQSVVRVLINLLDNAKKFTEKGKITLDYELDETGETITFIVSDSGRGIPKGKEETIFDRFKQLDITSPGCGLGLYVSRLIATLLGGTLTVDTDYRGGARFLFRIPAK